MAFGGMGGLGGDLELALVIKGVDEASSVFETIAGGLEGIIQKTADFQSALNQVQGNTTLSTAGLDAMRKAVLDLNAQSGAPLTDLTAAFQHVTNVGFDMADATKVVTAAMESAISTGSSTADVANVLGMQMHEFGIQAAQAGVAMNVLHLASAQSNTSLDNYVESTSKAVAMAANLGVSFVDANAALSALGRHMDISQANTTFAGELVKMVANSKAATAEIAHLGEVTGIPLAYDFTSAGLAARGFQQVQEDLAKATGGNSSEMLKLIAATRGGLSAMVLAGSGASDFKNAVSSLSDAWAGKLDPTTQGYTRTLGTFNQQVAIVGANFNQFLMQIGQPIIDTLSPYLQQLIGWMNTHRADVDAFGHAIGTTVGGAISNFVQNVPHMFAAVQGEVAQFTSLTDSIGSFFTTLGSNVQTTIQGIVGGLFDVWAGFEQVNAQMWNGVVGMVENVLHKIYGATANMPGGPYGLADSAHISGASILSADDLLTQHNKFMYSIFGQSFYQGMTGGSGGLPGLTAAQMDLANFVGGPWASSAGRVAGGPGGAGAGGAGSPSGSPYAGQGAAAPGYLDAQQAIAAATRLLRDAQDRFGIDLTTHRALLGDPGVHRQLTGDISAIIKTMVPLLGYDTLDRQRAQVDYLAQIADHTKTAATHLGGQVSNPLLGFRLPQEPGYGQTIASFASLRETSDREQMRALQAQVTSLQAANASLQAQLAAVYGQNKSLQNIEGHALVTAAATHRLSREASRPHQDPIMASLRRHGVMSALR